MCNQRPHARFAFRGTLIALSLLLSALLASPAAAQCPGAWVPLASPNTLICSLAPLPDGRIAALGNFTTPSYASSLAIYDPAANLWTPLPTTINASRITALPDGDLFAAGCFTNVGNIYASGAARYHIATNTWSPVNCAPHCGTSTCPIGVSLAKALPSGRVVIAGSGCFGYDLDGAYGLIYNPATNTTAQSPFADNIIEAPNGDVFGSYMYSAWRNSPQGLFYRIDGATGHESTIRWSGFGTSVNSIAMSDDGTVIVTGWFYINSESFYTNVARYNPATGFWTSLDANRLEYDMWLDSVLTLPGGDVVGKTNRGLYRYVTSRHRWYPLDPVFRPYITQLPNGDLLRTESSATTTTLYRYHFTGSCPTDFNCSGGPDIGDLFEYLNIWFARDPRAEMDGFPNLTPMDVLTFIAAWFAGC